MTDMIELAERIAREAHKGQLEPYEGRPYMNHVERVVAQVKGEAKAVAYLHDVIEDSVVMTPHALVDAGIPLRVVDAVVLLTRGEETYTSYIERLREEQNPLALAVKIADLRDHLREETLNIIPQGLRRRYERALERLVTA